jgi:SAM-dependent methyltransferase
MKIKFEELEDLPIGLSSKAVIDAFQPFVCADATARDHARLARRLRNKAMVKAIKRVISGGGGPGSRKESLIVEEYDHAWSKGFSAYDLSAGCKKPEPWVFRDQPLMADRAGVPRFRSVILSAVLRSLRPKRVLEVGCGNGVNLLLLANRFPEIAFTGLELTEAGNRVAKAIQSLEALPDHLLRYIPEEQSDPQAFRRIDFVQGDATCMPFADGEFDLVFTVLAVEQMERIRHEALNEIARVSGGFVLNLEPFAEANRTAWRRIHVLVRDYFRGTISSLPDYGLQPLWATMDFPQEMQLGAALVLSRKTGS